MKYRIITHTQGNRDFGWRENLDGTEQTYSGMDAVTLINQITTGSWRLHTFTQYVDEDKQVITTLVFERPL